VQLNTLCGNAFAYKNALYPQFDIYLSGNYRNLDIAPQELLKVYLEADDTPRKIVWNGKAFHIIAMDWMYDGRSGILSPYLVLHEVTAGTSGIVIAIPPLPPTGDDGGGFDIPPIYIPEFPPISIGAGGINIYHNGVFVATVNGLNFVDDVCAE